MCEHRASTNHRTWSPGPQVRMGTINGRFADCPRQPLESLRSSVGLSHADRITTSMVDKGLCGTGEGLILGITASSAITDAGRAQDVRAISNLVGEVRERPVESTVGAERSDLLSVAGDFGDLAVAPRVIVPAVVTLGTSGASPPIRDLPVKQGWHRACEPATQHPPSRPSARYGRRSVRWPENKSHAPGIRSTRKPRSGATPRSSLACHSPPASAAVA